MTSRAWLKVASTAWAITDDALDNIDLIVNRLNDSPDVIAARLGKPLDNTYNVEVRDGVAILPVMGPLTKYANFFSMVSGATSYELLARDFTKALANDEVTAIMLHIDSPGGEANGVSEVADMIYSARGKKPIVAYISGSGASGAYWLASAADKIVMSDTAQVGSIGAILAYEKKNKKDVERVRIVSEQSPYKALDPGTENGNIRYREKLTQLADVFISKVAMYRGVDKETVLSEYGKGDTFMGVYGVTAGLADEIGTFEGVMQSIVQSSSTGGFLVTDEGESNMATSEKTSSAKSSAAASVEQKTPEITAQFVADKHPAIADSFREEGAKASASRIESILVSEQASGRAAVAMKLAFGTKLSAEDAIGVLEASPKAVESVSTGNQFAEVMKAAGNPDVGANEVATSKKSVWSEI